MNNTLFRPSLPDRAPRLRHKFGAPKDRSDTLFAAAIFAVALVLGVLCASYGYAAEPPPVLGVFVPVPANAESPILQRLCDRPVPVYCGPGITESDCQLVGMAVRFWNNQASHPFFLFGGMGVRHMPKGDEVVVTRIAGNAPPVIYNAIAFTYIHPNPTTMCSRGSAVVEFSTWHDKMTDMSLYHTYRHELGHVLGLKHVEQPWCIMSPSGPGDLPVAPTFLCEQERELLRAIYGQL